MGKQKTDAEILEEANKRFRCSEEKDRGMLLSNPPQYHCERCPNTWVVGRTPPFCQKANLTDFLTEVLASRPATSEVGGVENLLSYVYWQEKHNLPYMVALEMVKKVQALAQTGVGEVVREIHNNVKCSGCNGTSAKSSPNSYYPCPECDGTGFEFGTTCNDVFEAIALKHGINLDK